MTRFMRTVVLFGAVFAGGAVACAPTNPYGPQTGGSILGTNGGGFSDMGQRETLGAILGGIAGTVAGAQYGRHGSNERYAMMALGALAGGLLGQQIGQGLDRAAQANRAMAFRRMMVTGTPQQWQGQTTQGGWVYGSFEPVQQHPNGCRTYTQTIVIDGRPQQAMGTACPNIDGTWRIVQ
jgi:surface antigen